jgi:hypothetical protein
VVLDDFDLASVRVRYKEELCQEPPLMVKLLHECWSRTHWLEVPVPGRKVIQAAMQANRGDRAEAHPPAKLMGVR